MSTMNKDVSSVSDSNRFLGWFMVGAVSMLALKLVVSVNQLYVTAAPLTVMALYFAQLIRGHHETNRPERAGDNIYYLGFLFTLVSLGLALYEFGDNPGNKSSLISDFAVALTTTIFGVLGRVWMNQGDKEIDEYEREAKLHVSDAIDELKSDVEHSREVMRDFATVTKQVLEENRDEQRKQLDRDREQFDQHFTESLKNMSEVMTNAVTAGSERIKTELEKLAASTAEQVSLFTTNVSALNTSSAELASVLGATVESLNKLPNADEIINTKIDAIIAPLHKGCNDMVALFDKQIAWSKSSENNAQIVASTVQSLSSDMQELTKATRTSIDGINSPVQELLRTFGALQGVLSSISGSLGGMSEAALHLKKIPDHIGTSVDDFRATIAQFDASTRQFSSKMDALNAAVSSAQKRQLEQYDQESLGIAVAVEQRQTLNNSMGIATKGIEEAVHELKTQLKQMSGALIDAVKFLSDASRPIA